MQPIETIYQTGQTLYAVVRGVVSGSRQVWNTTLNSGSGGWETYSSGHWSQYAIAMTEENLGYYYCSFPAGISNVITTETLWLQGGGSPTLGDTGIGIGQSQGENVVGIAGDATAPTVQTSALLTMLTGTVVTGSLTAMSFSTDVVNANINFCQGRAILFLLGSSLANQGGTIISYDPNTQIITVAASFTSAPVNADSFIIV